MAGKFLAQRGMRTLDRDIEASRERSRQRRLDEALAAAYEANAPVLAGMTEAERTQWITGAALLAQQAEIDRLDGERSAAEKAGRRADDLVAGARDDGMVVLPAAGFGADSAAGAFRPRVAYDNQMVSYPTANGKVMTAPAGSVDPSTPGVVVSDRRQPARGMGSGLGAAMGAGDGMGSALGAAAGGGMMGAGLGAVAGDLSPVPVDPREVLTDRILGARRDAATLDNTLAAMSEAELDLSPYQRMVAPYLGMHPVMAEGAFRTDPAAIVQDYQDAVALENMLAYGTPEDPTAAMLDAWEQTQAVQRMGDEQAILSNEDNLAIAEVAGINMGTLVDVAQEPGWAEYATAVTEALESGKSWSDLVGDDIDPTDSMPKPVEAVLRSYYEAMTEGG